MLTSKRFTGLATNSSIEGVDLVDNCPVDMPAALCPLKVQPYGQDPVFNPFSDIYDDDLPGLDYKYYNTTTVMPINIDNLLGCRRHFTRYFKQSIC